MEMNPSKPHGPNRHSAATLHFLSLWALISLSNSCALQDQSVASTKETTFDRVKPVLERNCVHYHGTMRLPGMPAMNDTEALSRSIGPNQFIVPGEPGNSRFLAVATLSDNQAGAMPPTGHAITAEEAEILRSWIESGAPLPKENTPLNSQGASPRSR